MSVGALCARPEGAEAVSDAGRGVVVTQAAPGGFDTNSMVDRHQRLGPCEWPRAGPSPAGNSGARTIISRVVVWGSAE